MHRSGLVCFCSGPGLGLSQDVAGATFMAAGSSAPELVTAFLGDQANHACVLYEPSAS